MEWIYTRTKASGQGSLELALENRKNERKNDKLIYSFTQLIQAHPIISMDVWGLDR